MQLLSVAIKEAIELKLKNFVNTAVSILYIVKLDKIDYKGGQVEIY